MNAAKRTLWLVSLLLANGCTDRGLIGRICPQEQIDCASAAAGHPMFDGAMAGQSMLDGAMAGQPMLDSAMAGQPMLNEPDAGACHVQALSVEPKALAIYVTVDNSFSMSGWWGPLMDGFNQFVADAQSAGISVGLSFFGESCDVATYTFPRFPISPLPSNSTLLMAEFPTTPGEFHSGALPGLRGAIMYARGWALQHPGYKTVVLLVTSNLDNDCGTNEAEMIQVAQHGVQDPVSIPTYVLALDDYTLDPIAAAGGTGKALLVESLDFQAPLQRLISLRDTARPVGELSCSMVLPAGEHGNLESSQLRLTLKDGRELPIAAVRDRAACDAASSGFYYDDQAPASVVLCERSCGSLHDTARVDLLSECAHTRL